MMNLKCGACNLEYSHKLAQNTPRVLVECGHTFCDECCMQARTNHGIVCMKCNIHSSYSVKRGLMPNRFILDLLTNEEKKTLIDENRENEKEDEWSKSRKLRIPCEENDNHTAVFFCHECDVNLCESCLSKVHVGNIFKKHKVQPLTKKIRKKNYCDNHPKSNADYYVETKDGIQTICKKCSKNVKENLEKVEEKNEELFETVLELLEWAREQETMMESYQFWVKNAKYTYSQNGRFVETLNTIITLNRIHANSMSNKKLYQTYGKLESSSFYKNLEKKMEKDEKEIDETRKNIEIIDNDLHQIARQTAFKVVIDENGKDLLETLSKIKIIEKDFVGLSEYQIYSTQKLYVPSTTPQTFQVPIKISKLGSFRVKADFDFFLSVFENDGCHLEKCEKFDWKLTSLNGKLYEIYDKHQLEEHKNDMFEKYGIVYSMLANNFETLERDLKYIEQILTYKIMENNKLVLLAWEMSESDKRIDENREKIANVVRGKATNEYKEMIEKFVKPDHRLSSKYLELPEESFDNCDEIKTFYLEFLTDLNK